MLSIADMEKQHRVLEKWTEHVAAQRAAAGPGAAPETNSPALKALQVVAALGLTRMIALAMRKPSSKACPSNERGACLAWWSSTQPLPC